jgi:hypothetical protein
MTKDLLLDLGEEYNAKNAWDGVTATFGVYLDSTDTDGDGNVEGDQLTETSTLSAITTEPSNANYARQSVTLNAADINGDWGATNASAVSFDFSDTTSEKWVDCLFVTLDFPATETSDGGTTTTHIVANPAMETDHDTGSVSSIDYDAGDIDITFD